MPFSLLALFTNLKINGKPINLLGASRRGDWRDAGMWGISDVHCSLFMAACNSPVQCHLQLLNAVFERNARKEMNWTTITIADIKYLYEQGRL